ncbi:MAG: GNAT family N-acetyltransferase [Acidimicrobiales bacterium]
MSDEITYARIEERWAPELEAIELSVFKTIDPSDLYHREELVKLARTFPEGNFVALDGERPIGMGLGILVDFDFEQPDHSLSDIAGDDGVSTHRPNNDWYYGTDISVYPEYRGRGIGRKLYELRKDCVRDLNKKGIVAGGVLPGYADHIDDMTAQAYIDKVKAGELYDSTLSFQIENGFDARTAIPNYLEDPTVGNWSVLIVWENPDYSPAG